MIRFHFEETLCTGCGACAIACMDLNDIDTRHGQRPYRRVFRYEDSQGFYAVSASCLHCPDAPCAAACPRGCLLLDPDSGLVLYDNDACVGCRACFRACPAGAPTFRETEAGEVMEKCDGCHVRLENGLPPVCVSACPTGAITLRDGDDPAARQELLSLYRRCRAPEAHTL